MSTKSLQALDVQHLQGLRNLLEVTASMTPPDRASAGRRPWAATEDLPQLRYGAKGNTTVVKLDLTYALVSAGKVSAPAAATALGYLKPRGPARDEHDAAGHREVQRRQLPGVIVVADAGIISDANMKAIKTVGCRSCWV